MKNLIAYYRVSTQRQGRSGLGLEAQREAVQAFAKAMGGTITAEFTEIESGRRNNREQLALALQACKKPKATLVIAKLDRLARKVSFVSTLMDSGVDFIACDNPHATRFTLHILAAVAEFEAEQISARTKAALKAAKARGVAIGRPNLGDVNRTAAADRAQALAPLLADLAHLNASAIASELNRRNITTAHGKAWTHKQVIRVQQRLERV